MARNFISGTDKISIASTAALDIASGPVSLYGWVYLNAGSQTHMLISKAFGSGSSPNENPYDLATNTGASPNLVLKRADSVTTFTKSSTFTLNVGAWTHVAVTDLGDGTANNCKMYKNAGTPDLLTATTVDGGGNTKPVLIGERDAPEGGNCRIAWVGIHNVVLTAEEIAEAMYRGFTMRGLVGCWPLLGDSPEPDLSGAAQNGTVTITSGNIDTGYKNPTTTGSPRNDFTSPSNAFSSDDTRSTATTLGLKQDYATFVLGVPADATINGIEVSVEWRAGFSSSPNKNYLDIDLSWDAGVAYTTIKTQNQTAGDPDNYVSSGGSADIWGRTWAAADFSDANFRCRLSYGGEEDADMSLEVDHLRVKVFHTQPASIVAGPPVLPLWVRSINEHLVAVKNVIDGFPGEGRLLGWRRFHQFLKTPQKTGVTEREIFNLNDLTP